MLLIIVADLRHNDREARNLLFPVRAFAPPSCPTKGPDVSTQPEPIRASDNKGWLDLGPRNLSRDSANKDILVPPASDSGTLGNLRFSFSDAHQRLEKGGWAREVTNRELPASTQMAGVNMALEPGAYREMHWHKEAEWGGHARRQRARDLDRREGPLLHR